MTPWYKFVLLATGFVAGFGVAWKLAKPPVQPPIPVPVIVTVHDTVKTPVDTIFLHGPKVVTTDTVELVITQTLHDTVQIPVNNPDTLARPPIWPILALVVGEGRGDTTRVATMALRSGRTMTSTLWTPGPLHGVWADTSGTPRLSFYLPSGCAVALADKLKYGAIGGGIVGGGIELLRIIFGRP
jgi:hypothetical protein